MDNSRAAFARANVPRAVGPVKARAVGSLAACVDRCYERAMMSRRLAAWGVHLYTASGAVIGLLALDAIARGALAAAFAWMALAMLIDSTDGTLARRARVKEVLPYFDGS